MIPAEIVKYLVDHEIPFTRHWHPRAVSAQKLAAAIHVSGYRVAKSVIIDVDGQKTIALLPAAEMLDEARVAEALGAEEVKLVEEAQFDALFPGCEVGAEPPFGGLYGLPVIADSQLAEDDTIVFRAGSHEETIEMRWEDFAKLESCRVLPIGRPFAMPAGMVSRMAPEVGPETYGG